ncbi:hypothetical protein HK097_003621 [Rhizophlyctis rosea]|uniref:F-box domain-containing protein n=1 Tax=Rhizophlyctis rosea TaxID=64517 RepID=A0AAD5SGH7_9FUNG|nr:hypothetical protein HK097_003621 [Rhizophlyctis rosea]
MAITATMIPFTATTPTKPPAAEPSSLMTLPTDVMLPILSYLTAPAALLSTCRATHRISKDPYTRAIWILSQLRSGNNDVPQGLVAFWVGIRHRIVTKEVMKVLESKGTFLEKDHNGMPGKAWDGWRLIAMAVGVKGSEEVVKIAVEKGLIRDWKTFVQSAVGAGREGVVGRALEHQLDQESDATTDASDSDSASSFSDSSDSENDTLPRKRILKPIKAIPSSRHSAIRSDPILQNYLLRHAISTNSSVLFHKACAQISPTSEVWSLISSYLFTTASPKILTTLASFMKVEHIPVAVLLMSARTTCLASSAALESLAVLVKLGAVDFKSDERDVGALLVRSAALDGAEGVVEAFVRMGVVVDKNTVESAKVGGSKKCVKILKAARL